jgi:hypothetical protein
VSAADEGAMTSGLLVTDLRCLGERLRRRRSSSRFVSIVSLNLVVAPIGSREFSHASRLGSVVCSSIAEPGLAQTILEHEPLYLAPYEAAYVYDASCGTGMALKVTGSVRNLPRKKLCVSSTLEQASLLGVTPFDDPVARAR